MKITKISIGHFAVLLDPRMFVIWHITFQMVIFIFMKDYLSKFSVSKFIMNIVLKNELIISFSKKIFQIKKAILAHPVYLGSNLINSSNAINKRDNSCVSYKKNVYTFKILPQAEPSRAALCIREQLTSYV